MGAGIVECDVTFTKDKELVCRHSQYDLHTTTNILAIPACRQVHASQFVPARIALAAHSSRRRLPNAARATSRSAEFKTLCGKMDASNPRAPTPAEFLGGTADFAPISTPAQPAARS